MSEAAVGIEALLPWYAAGTRRFSPACINRYHGDIVGRADERPRGLSVLVASITSDY
jgi:hypothetical protein